MPRDSLKSHVVGVAALAEPVRRALYQFVGASVDPTSREQAAAGVDVPVHVAKFHLDKLVDAGLLVVEFRRLSHRPGRGGGRPSKLYRRSDTEFAVSLPERHYDLLARILANAVVESSLADEPVTAAAARIAHGEGCRYGQDAATSDPGSSPLDQLTTALRGSGYEPRVERDKLFLDSCPFHRVAQEQTAFVCGLNLEFVSGIVDGLGYVGANPSLEPRAGHCCVSVARAE